MIAAAWNRLTGRAKPETRSLSGDTFAAAFGVLPTASGQYVNPRLAENLATVSACVAAVSSTLASLPGLVFQRTAAGRTEAPMHPVARLVRQPNPRQSWPDWVETTISHVLLYGNALSVIEHDGAGRPTALTPIPWQNVQVLWLPSGRLGYDIVHFTPPFGGTGTPRRYLEGEVFHLKDRSDDGILGRSRISRAPEVLGNAMALQDFAAHAWKNQATPSGAVEIEASLSEPHFKRLQNQFDTSHAGTSNARRVLILDNKASWKSLSVSPEDAEVLASRKFSVEELCRLFQVPPPLVQDYSRNTFTNATTAGLWFAQFSLAPWAKKIEAEFARSVFGSASNYELEIDLSGLVRGDYSARWAAYALAIQNGILDRNEVREQEGYGPAATAPTVAP